MLFAKLKRQMFHPENRDETLKHDEINYKLKTMILFFDTETTGLPKNWKAAVSDLNNWPRMVQLAWIVYENDGIKLKEGSYIIKPIGFSIPSDATKLHGITNEMALSKGVDLKTVLNNFFY